MLLATALVSATLFATGLIDIRSVGQCPSVDDVRLYLQPLLPGDLTRASDAVDVATIEILNQGPDETALQLQLVRDDGSLVGQRRLVLRTSCQEMAATVATLLAAWETDPTVAGSLPVEQGGPRVAGPAVQTIELLFAAGAGAALVGGTAATAAIEARVGAARSRWRARLGASRETARTVALPPGTVDWKHTTFALGLARNWLDRPWLLSADVGPTAGWMTLEASGLSPSRTHQSFEYGATGALRLGRAFGRWALWIEARGSWWVRGQRVSVSGRSDGKDLPAVEIGFSAGGSLRVLGAR